MLKYILKLIISFALFILVIQVHSQNFTDVTVSANITVPAGMGFTVVWVDYNNDGFPDFFGSADETFFYMNNGDGTFTNVTQSTGLAGIDPNSITVADYDKDGHKDMLITSKMYGVPVTIYRNINGEYFQAVENLSDYAENALWLDYNNDGDLDVFIIDGYGVELFKNNGDNTFQEVTDLLGLTNITGKTASAADYNNDGFTDIYVGSSSNNTLIKNIAGALYQNVTNFAGVADFRKTVAVAWGDYNDDGYTDLYSANIQSNRNVLFRNNGNGKFTDVTEAAGVPDIGDARNCSWIDYNNDSWLDLFNTNHVNSNKLYRNDEDGTFTNVASGAGITDPEDGFGVSWSDYDLDGDLDVIICGHTGLTLNLLRNDGGNSENYLFLNLKGVFDNASGIGTRIKLYANEKCQTQDLCGATGTCGQNALPVHFGLNTATVVDSIILRWQSGMIQKLYDISANQIIDITQEGNVPPCIFHLIDPVNDTIIEEEIIDFIWTSSKDPDNNNPIEYNLTLNSSMYDTLITGISDTLISVDLSDWVIPDTIQWRVIATDSETYTNSWENWNFIYSPTVGVEDMRKITGKTGLSDNYPNPFSQSTVIGYQLPVTGKVVLKVYNMKGQEIRTLVNEKQAAGNYSVIWDGTNISGNFMNSGIYFFRLCVDGDIKSVRKCLLLK